ncbi:MAG: thioredoxin domain-containing protein, partial [Acidimicrobiales bacterium]
GRNILHRAVRGDLVRPIEVEQARKNLFEARCLRVRPGLDDKVLTEWNATFCAALAQAAAVTGNPGWFRAAVRIGEFLQDHLRRPEDGRWLRSWQEGRARHLAYASDYANLIDAFTRLGELTGKRKWTEAAIQTADEMLDLFWDVGSGGLFTTGNDAERLIVRSKDLFDGSTPSANAVGAVALCRLGALTGNDRYRRAAEEILATLRDVLPQHPTAFAHVIGALDMLISGTTEVVVVGEREDLATIARAAYLPRGVLAWGEEYPSPLWEARQPGWAYVCENYSCLQPVADGIGLARQLAVGNRTEHPPRAS